ncbi:MAG TPA: glucoamylase family protein [Terriglobales bacterium]|nr:glucoamylase family protein [Terriglobales bacterium]
MRQVLGAAGCIPLTGFVSTLAEAQKQPASAASSPLANGISPEDDQFLDDLEKTTFQYFWDQANPKTGLVKDRCNVRVENDTNVVGSIASTGFGLTALCIGANRGYIQKPAAQERVLSTLRSLWGKLPNHRGFFYHWANIATGERVWDAEVSSVDTAILLCGVITCREYFSNAAEVQALADDIFDRVEWTWLSEDTSLLPHGWTPEIGFLPYRWDNYSELMMMYLLGLGSTNYPLRDDAWTAWKRLKFEYDGQRYIGSFAPLFVHQYSQAWFDFRGRRDKYADYFQNSVIATEVHKRFCLELSKKFPSYSDDLWGITASDSPNGYVIWGGPPAVGPIDGTVVPSASAGSLPYLPQAVLRVLRHIKDHYPYAYTKYGFVNAFNPLTKWYDDDVIGIDTGITLLMAENVRSGFVWNTFMKSEEAQRGMSRAGLKKY